MSQEMDWLELADNPTEEKAVAYAQKYHPHTAHFKPEALLAGVHKARLKMMIGTEKQYESINWLKAHGYKTGSNG